MLTHSDADSGQTRQAASDRHRGVERCTVRNAARKIATCLKASITVYKISRKYLTATAATAIAPATDTAVTVVRSGVWEPRCEGVCGTFLFCPLIF
jgi:hypothetical protein